MTWLIPPPVHAVHSRPTPRRFSKLRNFSATPPPPDEESAAHVLAAGLQNNYSLSVKKNNKRKKPKEPSQSAGNSHRLKSQHTLVIEDTHSLFLSGPLTS